VNCNHLFWAKLGQATWPEEYHPVQCHLVDVAAVTRRLELKVLAGNNERSGCGRCRIGSKLPTKLPFFKLGVNHGWVLQPVNGELDSRIAS